MTAALKRASASILAVGALVALLLYMQGVIGGRRTPPGTAPLPVDAAPAGRFVAVERRAVPDHREWAGTVRARTTAMVAPRVMARVREIRVAPGARVVRGDILATLDDTDLAARAEQARAALVAAEALALQADAELARTSGLHAKAAATPRDLEATTARAGTARAAVSQARDAVRETESMLAEAIVRAPFDGVVAEQRAEPGDVAVPGRPLFAVHDLRRLRLEAQVPESCARGATLGAAVIVRIESLERDLGATLDEVAPMADPLSRTFLVKAALPETDGVKPGMFGRFLQPCGVHDAIAVPEAAVTRLGQIESVLVRDARGGPPRARHVKTGKRLAGGAIEVLSGLAPGEQVLVPGAGP